MTLSGTPPPERYLRFSGQAVPVLGVAVVLMALLWVMLVFTIHEGREAALHETHARNLNLALAHKDRANSALQLFDQTLLALRDDYAHAKTPPLIEPRLAALQVDRRYVGIVSLIGPTGRVLATTTPMPEANFSDRQYFRFHAAEPADQLLVGPPIQGKATGKWLISLTRRITAPDGTFGGVVFMALDPTFFATDYEKIDLGPHAALALIGLDGITRVRRNAGKISFGEDIRASQLFKEIPYAASGSYVGKAASDGQLRAVSYSVLSGYPMVVVVGSSVDDVMQALLPREVLLSGLGALGSGLIAALAAIFLLRNRKSQAALLLLEQSEGRLKTIVEVSPVPMALNARGGDLTFLNAAFVSCFGYTLTDIPTVQAWQVAAYPDLQYRQWVRDASRGHVTETGHQDGRLGRLELTIRCKNGTDKTVLASVSFLSNATGGEYLAVLYDVTDTVAAARKLEHALQEKVVLLNEVHHRVKNNLQVITSLLRLEAGRSAYAPTKVVLQDMQGRIRSMALLHESLYRSGVFARVDLGAYLKQLATQAFRSVSDRHEAVRLALELDAVNVSLDQATPCGLLVNELISNCFKHAFPHGTGGVLRIELKNLPALDGQAPGVRLCVSDTGVGLPADFEVRRAESLGMQLVADLSTQIGGILIVGLGPGAEFCVTFKPELVYEK